MHGEVVAPVAEVQALRDPCQLAFQERLLVGVVDAVLDRVDQFLAAVRIRIDAHEGRAVRSLDEGREAGCWVRQGQHPPLVVKGNGPGQVREDLVTCRREMATLTRNLVVAAGAPAEAAFEIVATPTPLQARAYALLNLSPAGT
jgi:hypothetical protein